MQNELRFVVNALPALVWTALPDGHVDFLNQRWSEYTGVRVEDSYGIRWQIAIHPEDLPQLLERWGSAIASGEPRERRLACDASMASTAGFISAQVR